MDLPSGRKGFKTLRRFFIEKIDNRNGACLIKGAEARHITKVLRMGPGDVFILMDGQGDQYRVRIKSVNRYDLSVSIEDKLPPRPSAPVRITIGQAVLKHKAMDMLVQKCSELGVDRIVPFFSERTSFGDAGDRLENKVRRWLEISRNAAKQSGRQRPVEIGQPLKFDGLLVEPEEEDFKIILYEGEKARDLKRLIRGSSSRKKVFGLVGPEGGFTDREMASAGAAGFMTVSLGHRILRAETAGITLTAIIQYEWGDLGVPDSNVLEN